MQIVKNTTILFEPFFDLFTYFIYKFPYSADYFLTLHYI